MKNHPLVVDLDGTLIRTDMLHESALRVLRDNPLDLLFIPYWLSQGKAVLKRNLSNRSSFDPSFLPYNHDLLNWLKQQKIQGRKLILCTATDHAIAICIAEHLGIFDEVMASDGITNLAGKHKAEALEQRFGHTGFDYAGNSRADLVVWKRARQAVVVNASTRLVKKAEAHCEVERVFSSPALGFKDGCRALRVHQWMKNLLLFVPLLTAFSFQDIDKLQLTIMAFFAFSLVASATYMGNDCWDLDNDRVHSRKKFRAFASGKVSILKGILAAGVLLILGLVLAYNVSLDFLWMLLLYLATTISYTMVLKAYVLIDVLVLSLLYTLRIIAGSVAVAVPTSVWLLAFSVAIFFSLALVKRCSELVALQQTDRQATQGREYRISDLTVLWPLGVSAAISAVVVFGLFINADETKVRYAHPQILWLVAIGLIYWLARLWIKTSRGEMHDDPLIFAVRDFGSRMTILMIITATLFAHFFPFF